jgi:hypothetical protein
VEEVGVWREVQWVISGYLNFCSLTIYYMQEAMEAYFEVKMLLIGHH